jgi:hypothetical protein
VRVVLGGLAGGEDGVEFAEVGGYRGVEAGAGSVPAYGGPAGLAPAVGFERDAAGGVGEGELGEGGLIGVMAGLVVRAAARHGAHGGMCCGLPRLVIHHAQSPARTTLPCSPR